MKLQNSLRREASICFILRFRHLPKGAESASCQWNKYIQQLIQTDDETISWSLEFRSFCGKSQIQKVNLGPNSSRGMPWPFQSPRNLPEVHLNLCTLRRSLVVASMGTKNSGSTFCLKQPGCLICKTFENQSKNDTANQNISLRPAHQMSWIGLFPADQKVRQGNIWVTNLFHDVSRDSILLVVSTNSSTNISQQESSSPAGKPQKKLYIYICINIYIPSNPVGLDDRIPIMNNSKKLISMKLAKGSE